jgi:YD repeat-containing protein
MGTQLEGGFPDYVTATAAYDDWGRLQSMGGMSYEYNSFGQLSRYTHGTYEVSYDYVGSRGFNDGTLAAQTVNGALTSYTYDLLGRLETATRSGQWSQFVRVRRVRQPDQEDHGANKRGELSGGPADEPADGSGDVRCGGEPHLEPERGL